MSKEIHIKVERLYGWDRFPYWYAVSAKDPYAYKTGVAFFKSTAIRKARRVAKNLAKVNKLDEVIFEEDYSND